MKKNILKWSMLICLFVALVSCGNDDNDANDDSGLGNSFFTAEIEGANYDAGLIVAQMTSEKRYIAITTSETVGGGNALSVSIGSLANSAAPLAVGTYNTEDENNTAIIFLENGTTSYQTFDIDATGTVTITDLDEENMTISGNFQGTLTNFGNNETVTVTNGVFQNIEYTEN